MKITDVTELEKGAKAPSSMLIKRDDALEYIKSKYPLRKKDALKQVTSNSDGCLVRVLEPAPEVKPYYIRMLEEDRERIQAMINKTLKYYPSVTNKDAKAVLDLRLSIWNRNIADINSAIYNFSKD